MAFILDTMPSKARTTREIQAEIRHMQEQYRLYWEYIEAIKDKLPASAYAFATVPWHYGPGDLRNLHDSWIERVTIQEIEREAGRTIDIEICLLAPYHTQHITLRYHDVIAYQMSVDGANHGDWMIDEVRLSERGLVIHEIFFIQARRYWLIECNDITCDWDVKLPGFTYIDPATLGEI